MIDDPNIDDITTQKTRYAMQLFDEDRPKMTNFFSEQNTDVEHTIHQFGAFMSELGAARQEKIDVFNARLNEDLTNKRRVQENVALTFSRISPTSVFTYAATELAGTSIKLQSQFLDEAYNSIKKYSRILWHKKRVIHKLVELE